MHGPYNAFTRDVASEQPCVVATDVALPLRSLQTVSGAYVGTAMEKRSAVMLVAWVFGRINDGNRAG